LESNIFTVLGIQTREDCVTNAIAYAFNSSAEFRYRFLDVMCGKDPGNYQNCVAYTRLSAGIAGIPDLVITLESSEIDEIVVIENKLKAEEGEDQTKRYASSEAISALAERLLAGKPCKSSFVFLTLFPDQEPSAGKRYIVKSHSEFKKIADGIANWDNALAEKLIKDWSAITCNFYERQKVAMDDKFFDKMTDEGGLDAGYLYFRQALSRVELPAGLEVEEFFRSSQQGRHYYGVAFSKESWHPGEMSKSSEKWSLDPNKHYNIHFEPQYDLWGKFKCYLHYEVNPYFPEKWIQNNIQKEQYDRYLARRTAFSGKLREKGLVNWSFGGGVNQIAKMEFNAKNSLYSEVKAELESNLAKMAKAVDAVLADM